MVGNIFVDEVGHAGTNAGAADLEVRATDRVGHRGLRPYALPHHRTYGFPYTAVGPGGGYRAARSDGIRNPCRRNRWLFRAVCRLPVRAMGQAPLLEKATFSI